VENPQGRIGPGEALAASADAAAAGVGEEPSAEEPAPLIPPGPLESVRILPSAARLPVGAEKPFTAHALDATGRRLRNGVAFSWKPVDGPGRLDDVAAARTTYRAEATGTARLRVEARQQDRLASAEATVEILEEIEPAQREEIGIPEPLEVKDPTGRWRSRIREGHWEFNGSHPDYLMVAADAPRRLRYLAMLLAKELVLRQSGGGGQEERTLESLVELLTAIEDRLGRPARKGS
jgi:hypothetical protein